MGGQSAGPDPFAPGPVPLHPVVPARLGRRRLHHRRLRLARRLPGGQLRQRRRRPGVPPAAGRDAECDGLLAAGLPLQLRAVLDRHDAVPLLAGPAHGLLRASALRRPRRTRRRLGRAEPAPRLSQLPARPGLAQGRGRRSLEGRVDLVRRAPLPHPARPRRRRLLGHLLSRRPRGAHDRPHARLHRPRRLLRHILSLVRRHLAPAETLPTPRLAQPRRAHLVPVPEQSASRPYLPRADEQDRPRHETAQHPSRPERVDPLRLWRLPRHGRQGTSGHRSDLTLTRGALIDAFSPLFIYPCRLQDISCLLPFLVLI